MESDTDYITGQWAAKIADGSVITKKLPKEFQLDQNYPNPFNPSSEISFALPEASKVVLKVYNIAGEKVTVLINGVVNIGYHTTTFDGSNLASGVYIYKAKLTGLESGKVFSATKRMLLVK